MENVAMFSLLSPANGDRKEADLNAAFFLFRTNVHLALRSFPQGCIEQDMSSLMHRFLAACYQCWRADRYVWVDKSLQFAFYGIKHLIWGVQTFLHGLCIYLATVTYSLILKIRHKGMSVFNRLLNIQ